MRYGVVLGIAKLLEKHSRRARFHWSVYCQTQFDDDREANEEAMLTYISESMQVVGLLAALHVASDGASLEYGDFISRSLVNHRKRKADKRDLQSGNNV